MRIDNNEKWSLTDGLLRRLLHCAKKRFQKHDFLLTTPATFYSHFTILCFILFILFSRIFFDFTDKDADNLEETEAREQGVKCSKRPRQVS